MSFMQALQHPEMVFSHDSSLMVYILVGLTLLLLFTLIQVLLSSSKPDTNTLPPPPSPPRLPIIGNFHQVGSSYPHRSLAALSSQYGPLMLLHLGQKKALVVSSAHAAAQVLKTHDLAFCNRPKSVITAKLMYNYKDVASAPYGEFWRHIRSLCVLQLLSAKRVQSFRSVREEETYNMMERIGQSCLKSEPIDLSETLMGLANNVVCRVALGRKYNDRSFKNLLSKFIVFLGRFNLADFVPWLNWIHKLDGLDAEVDRTAKDLDEFLDQVIEDHQMDEGTEPKRERDFVDVLLGVQKETQSLDMDSIKGIILVSSSSLVLRKFHFRLRKVKVAIHSCEFCSTDAAGHVCCGN
uniref:Cytochrome P450 n=1 Tax=Kalanchoe fedtschenkoi TaxID=63787 RepID=A0A7N0ZVF0_KALFE